MTQLLKQKRDIGQIGTPGGIVAPSYTKVALVSTLKAGRGQGQSDISAWRQPRVIMVEPIRIELAFSRKQLTGPIRRLMGALISTAQTATSHRITTLASD